jgi:hypothetical protein
VEFLDAHQKRQLEELLKAHGAKPEQSLDGALETAGRTVDEQGRAIGRALSDDELEGMTPEEVRAALAIQ